MIILYQTGEVHHRMEETHQSESVFRDNANNFHSISQSIIHCHDRDKDNNISVGKYSVRLGYSLYISNPTKEKPSRVDRLKTPSLLQVPYHTMYIPSQAISQSPGQTGNIPAAVKASRKVGCGVCVVWSGSDGSCG